MGNYVLQDLVMAGVRWELTETPAFRDVQGQKIQQNFSDIKQVNDKPVVVPPMAPITIDTVKSMAERPENVDSLIRMIGEFNHPLRIGSTNVVLPNIAINPNGLVIITDMPSAEDDLSGKILSGAAGEMTDKMLSAIGMSREDVSIVPLLFWRTPGGRTPIREELDLSLPFVHNILKMLSPRVVITFGTIATNEFAKNSLNNVHGNEILSDNGYIIIPMFHPNYLMLKPSAKKDVWNALQNVQKLLKNA